jgi:rhodanese-related sulfurtransferase
MTWFHEQRAGQGERRGVLLALAALSAGAALPIWAAAPGAAPDPAHAATTLEDVERAAFRAAPCPEITTEELARRLAQGVGMRLFDLREPDDHAAGHIAGAEPLDPFLAPSAFLALRGAGLAGARAVFLDLAGQRSTGFLARLRPLLRAAGPAESVSLRGGMLRWWAERRPMAGEGRLALPDEAWRALARRARG